MRQLAILVICFYLLAVVSTLAGSLDGSKQIALMDNTGERRVIGTVVFTPRDTESTYRIDWTEASFTEHFLSMRPFRCIEGPDRHWCHVPYPYDIRRAVSPDDLTDLEYDLLFLQKGATEYGINMWNGVYYRLRLDGGRLIGVLHEIDMGLLAVPPEDGNLRPITSKHLHEADPESHWLPRVVIE